MCGGHTHDICSGSWVMWIDCSALLRSSIFFLSSPRAAGPLPANIMAVALRMCWVTRPRWPLSTSSEMPSRRRMQSEPVSLFFCQNIYHRKHKRFRCSQCDWTMELAPVQNMLASIRMRAHCRDGSPLIRNAFQPWIRWWSFVCVLECGNMWRAVRIANS